MILNDLKIWKESEHIGRLWTANNSEVIGYYIGKYEAVIISEGARGATYLLKAERSYYVPYGNEDPFEDRDPKKPFDEWIMERLSNKHLLSAVKYIYKAQQLKLGRTLIPQDLLKQAMVDEL